MESRRSGGGLPGDVVVGLAIWVVVFALSTGPLADRIGLLEGLWLMGPLLVVPLGFGLLQPPQDAGRWMMVARRTALPTAVLVVASIVAEPGAASMVLAVPWALTVAISSWVGVRWLLVSRSLRAKVVVPVAGLVSLALAALTLLAWRGQLHPMDLSDAAVAVATVHLTFAGFGATVVADRTRAAATRRRSRSIAGIAGMATVVALALLAAGVLVEDPRIDLAASVILSAAVLVVAGVMLGFAVRRERSASSAALLVVSAGSLVFALVLAVQFAFGRWSDTYTLSVTRMLELHGTVAGLGFVVGGLLGWALSTVPDAPDG